ncbi:hypothetical protein Val02_75690 [Virgisporangium aliadipatigenens]|uniref:Secreted protein n=1 Tax=Virgisporangium aliadipatigenens TaxID=741659 RepID=A0A8J4DV19_9ACTN|nr:hypothetical protein [Virgisporangium aliadipatigenens]GIJ50683.1 hypothetical protein Val02_75690 [Virgisporangium aliadipatigenens]
MKAIRVATVLAVLGAGLAAGTPARAAHHYDGPDLVDTVPAVLHADQPTWLQTHWATDVRVCDFKLTVTNFAVDYPANTGTYASLYEGSVLERNDTDYAAFRVTAEAGPKRLVLRLRAAYRYAPDRKKCTGPVRTTTGTLRVPVVVDAP